ncbi:DNA-binding response regulator, LytR/AlgR family [Pseudarcicella hirudinis]|uniref:DNA-binding response regulator, LytR/AlgR family n=1 Tax=Pseudarcicella hirudinis TaxID=1079859 RepID=A0A1I5TRJ7_9BACT|nr:LytTR family DNA-binding domain-containing protein [Pseudarcicella hirudinis]SFP85531.1 DNA-binding response regulator, LytR/AlgR family [Pseudarcicella hirudinis]
MRCIVVDDEQSALEVLTTFIEQTPFLELVIATTNPIDAIGILQKQSVDVLFLDIHMPQISGLNVAKLVKGKTKVIFTTAYSDHAVDAFDLEAIDYLTKPISYDRFLRAVQKAMNSTSGEGPAITHEKSKEEDFLLIKTENKGKFIKVNVKDIAFVEGLKNYISIYTKEERVITLMNMKDLEERLPSDSFMRVHKSYIISLDKIKMIDGNQIFLHEVKGAVPLGESYRNPFFDALNAKVMGGKK